MGMCRTEVGNRQLTMLSAQKRSPVRHAAAKEVKPGSNGRGRSLTASGRGGERLLQAWASDFGCVVGSPVTDVTTWRHTGQMREPGLLIAVEALS